MPTAVAPGIHRFSDGFANWYVLDTDAGALLVDCGWPRSRDAVAESLRAVGHAPDSIAGVVLTHGHPDHLGTAAWLEQTWSVPVFAHDDELDRVRGLKPSTRSATLVLDLWRPHALRFIATAIGRGVSSPEWPRDPRPLSELPAKALEPVSTPGHTEGHAAYLVPAAGALLSGDALVTMSVLTGRRGPQLHPAAFQVDFGAARESLAAIAPLEAGVVLPGHGEPWHGSPGAAAARALER